MVGTGWLIVGWLMMVSCLMIVSCLMMVDWLMVVNWFMVVLRLMVGRLSSCNSNNYCKNQGDTLHLALVLTFDSVNAAGLENPYLK